MRILAIETATEACSAALYMDGEVAERFEIAPRRHTELILPMMTGLLAEAGLTLRDLDALAFGRGPGAFTGLRIAAGVVQGAALGAGLKVLPVSTLAALALEGLAETGAEYALVALDARMGEVYWGVYRCGVDPGETAAGDPVKRFMPHPCGEDRGNCLPGLLRAVGAEQVISPQQVTVPETLADAVAIGPGWETYGEVLQQRVGKRLRVWLPQRLPRAAWVARLAAVLARRGEQVLSEAAQPVYLRDRVVNIKGEK